PSHKQEVDMMDIFDARESAVRSYCRIWPTVFGRAVGSWLYDERGRGYLDFFSGAGALNYGHNNPLLKGALLRYLADDGVIHSLDMHTVAKREFLTVFDKLILRPRQLDYRVQFPGPGGANAVEAALKLARKVTGRTEVITFTNSFHGMTLGALAVTGNAFHRAGRGLRWVIRTRFRSVNPWIQTARYLTSSGSSACSRTRAAAWTPRPRRSSRPYRARAGSTSRARSGCVACRNCAESTASCSSSTTSRWAAAGQARSSASSPRGSPRTSFACRRPSAGTGCRSRSR